MSLARDARHSRPHLLRSLTTATALLALALLAAPSAAAPTKQDVATADRLFKEARTLMGQGKFEAACPKLEESQKLDPAPGTRYQLAVCYESTGRPATALAYYIEVADLAKAAGFKDKEKVARDKAAALEPKVPRIVFEVAPENRVPGLVIKRDGAVVDESQWNRPILMDPGETSVEATAPDRKPFKTSVAVKGDGARVTVPIALLPTDDTSTGAPPPPPPSALGPQRIAAIGVAAVGLGGIIAGSVLGLDAKSTYDKAIGDPSLCPTKKTCYPDGKSRVDQAQGGATAATVAFVAGGVFLAGGAVLFFTAPSTKPAPSSGQGATQSSMAVTPVIGHGFGGVTAFGQF